MTDNSDNEVFFKIYEGTPEEKECCNEELALSILLKEGVLFSNTGYFGDGDEKEKTVVLFVNCNDLFAWGCADAECVKHSEIGGLYRAWEADKKWGVDKWCAKRRCQKPQPPVIRAMKKDGVWDAEMEALADNWQDAETQAAFRAAAAQWRKEQSLPQEQSNGDTKAD